MACLLDWGPALAAALLAFLKIFAYLAAIRLFVGETYGFSASIVRRYSDAPLRTLPKCFLMAFASSLSLVTVCLVTAAFLAAERMPVSAIGLNLYPGSGMEAARGMGAAFVGILLLFLVGYHARWISIERSDVVTDFVPGLPRFCGGAAYTITGSIFEEIVLRGYTYTVLDAACGSVAAIVGSAAMFAVLLLWCTRDCRRCTSSTASFLVSPPRIAASRPGLCGRP